ncbi:PREDICTED: uncharacterized protein LOC108661138 [Theobroma cacao]|uniref:Uncharacterized protein LOC108661138 n=1 Tax=Theobroma cacao TaxID=3641 RepID=A0AB32VZ88_THECC|nr:PREDICTED: uncharacterized protein LOC108661138 [Theobroma cacao]
MFTKGTYGLLRYGSRVYVSDIDDLRREILKEAHVAAYVKVEHQRPIGLLQPLFVSDWKWEHIFMDFVTGLPRKSKGYDFIWVIVDRLTKSAHFLLVKTTYGAAQYARLYIDEIVRLDGVPITIEIVQETADKIQLIRDKMLVAQSHQKSYADHRHRELEFEVGDHMFLRVSSTKGIMRFGKKGKLSPRYIGPFETLERFGVVAYRLALSSNLTNVHPVFHVLVLWKYQPDPSHVIKHESLQLGDDMSYKEVLVAILDRQVKKLRSKEIASVKVQWRDHTREEVTWEVKDHM